MLNRKYYKSKSCQYSIVPPDQGFQRKMIYVYCQQLTRKKINKGEMWFKELLDRESKIPFEHQFLFGRRVFDFFNIAYGVAIEVDGYGHRARYDLLRDSYLLSKFGLITLRVKEFNEEQAKEVLDKIKNLKTLYQRVSLSKFRFYNDSLEELSKTKHVISIKTKRKKKGKKRKKLKTLLLRRNSTWRSLSRNINFSSRQYKQNK